MRSLMLVEGSHPYTVRYYKPVGNCCIVMGATGGGADLGGRERANKSSHGDQSHIPILEILL